MLGGLEETAFEEQAPKPKSISEGRARVEMEKRRRHKHTINRAVFLGAFCCAQTIIHLPHLLSDQISKRGFVTRVTTAAVDYWW